MTVKHKLKVRYEQQTNTANENGTKMQIDNPLKQQHARIGPLQILYKNGRKQGTLTYTPQN